jgi:hypothetical protein
MCGGEMCGALIGETESGGESGEAFVYIHTFFSQGMENVEAETDVVIKV